MRSGAVAEAHQVDLAVAVKEGDEQGQQQGEKEGVGEADRLVESVAQGGVDQQQGDVDGEEPTVEFVD